MMFLGTGASEAIPSMFCRCPYCEAARRNGGKDVRTRSSFRIDGRCMIDLGPDIFNQLTGNKLDLLELSHLLITHSHDDHFAITQLLQRDCAVPARDNTLHIYMSRPAAEWTRHMLGAYPSFSEAVTRSERYRLVGVEYFETFAAGELEVTGIKANHKGFGPDEYGLNYLIGLPDGRRMLYAADTGWYGGETWDFLSGKHADIVIMEATFGGRLDRGLHPDGHLDARSAVLMLDRMKRIGFISNDTRVFVTHINHKHSLCHDDMQKAFDGCGHDVTVAWDGLRIDAE